MCAQCKFTGKRSELSDICHLWRDLHFKVVKNVVKKCWMNIVI